MAVVLVAVAVLVLGPGRRHDVRPGVVDVPRASPAAASRALDALVTAVRERDGAALAGLAPAGDAAAADLLSGIGANARALDLREVEARYVDQAGPVADDGTWTGVVELTWRLGVHDAAASSADVLVSFAPTGDDVGVAGFAPPDGVADARLPLWLRGRLAVADAPGILVLVDGRQRLADAVATRVERGVEVVRRVLPRWSSPVVVEVPASAADLDETLGAPPGTYDGIAAVTTAAGSGEAPGAPVHVFVNPEVGSRLRAAGAQVVMSHELVHLATDATRTPMATWLLEGFADYVALRDVPLPDRTTLGRAIRLVREQGLPRALPGDAAFGTGEVQLQATYEEAWLACRVVAERLGEQGLLALYRAAASGADTDAALDAAGLPVAELTQRWRSRLADLAG